MVHDREYYSYKLKALWNFRNLLFISSHIVRGYMCTSTIMELLTVGLHSSVAVRFTENFHVHSSENIH